MNKKKGLGTAKITKNLINEIFSLHYEKGLRFDDIYSKREEYQDFWKLFCLSINSDKRRKSDRYSFDIVFDPKLYDMVKKDYYQKLKTIQSNKNFAVKIKEVKEQRDVGNGLLERNNEIVVKSSTEEVVYDDDGKELVRSKSEEIKKMKIERIEFASDITLEVFKLAKGSQKFTNEYFEDLMRASKGEETKKFKFNHLELAGKFKMIALSLADSMQDIIIDGSEEQIKDVTRRISLANKYAEMFDNVKRAELAPLYQLKAIHEAGLVRQQDLQGAITNDRLMIDYGNIVLKKEDNLLQDRDRMRKDLKEKGYVDIEEIMLKNILNVGGIVNEEIKQIESVRVEEVDED